MTNQEDAMDTEVDATYESDQASAPPGTPVTSIVESSPSQRGSSVGGDLLKMVADLLSTLERERERLFAVEDARRQAEMTVVRLEGQIALERELRQREAAELQQLKADLDARRQRARRELDRLATRRARPHEFETSPPAAESTESSSKPSAPSPSASSEVVDDSNKVESHPPMQEEPASQSVDSVLAGQVVGTPEVPQQIEEDPPLPPGWRYSSEIPSQKKAWRPFRRNG
jgi:hypothetical protein